VRDVSKGGGWWVTAHAAVQESSATIRQRNEDLSEMPPRSVEPAGSRIRKNDHEIELLTQRM